MLCTILIGKQTDTHVQETLVVPQSSEKQFYMKNFKDG